MTRHGQMIEVLKPAECRTCGAAIGFCKSTKTGRWYPTDTLVDSSAHVLVTSKTWFHKCKPEVVAAFQAAKASA